MGVIDDYRVAKLSFVVTDPTMRPFYTQKGEGTMSSAIHWNGLSEKGERVVSMQNYGYRLTVTDIKGVTEVRKGKIPVDTVLVRDGKDSSCTSPALPSSPIAPISRATRLPRRRTLASWPRSSVVAPR